MGISTDFLTYVLNYYDWMPYVGGSTRLKLTQGGMERAQLPIPPLAEQKRIADSLTAIGKRSQRVRSNLDRVRQLLDRLDQAVLAKAFRGALVAQNDEDEPAWVLLERIGVVRAAAAGKRGGRVRRGERESSGDIARGRRPRADIAAGSTD
jgi:type I restriction enzyme, S subunit